METAELRTLLRTLGISGTILTAVLIVGVSAFVYKTYLEATLTKLQIKEARKDLATA